MATSVNAIGLEGGSAGAAVTSYNYTAITVASGSNTVLIFCCGFSSPSVSGVTATWDNGGTNQAMTLIASQGASTFNNGPPVYAFGLLNPTAGAKTLRLAWTGSSEICGAALAYDGADTSSFAAAFTNVNKAGNTGTNPTISVSSATGNATVAVVLSLNNLSAPTQTAVFTESGFTYNNAYAVQRAAGAASVSLGWTGPSANNAIIGFNVAAGGGGGTTVNLTGASVTASAGTATIQVSDSITITGATVSALAGAASPSISDSVTISGASCSGLAGTVLETISKPLSGAAAAALAGVVTPQVSDSISISGATVTASAGLVLGSVAAVPSGAAASALAGAVGHGVLVAITGAQASALAGTVVAGSGTSAVISGASVSALSGAVGLVEQVGISGAAAVALAGAVTTTTGSGTTVNIAGAAVSAIAGTVTHQTAVEPVGASVAALAGSLGKIIAAAMSGAAAAAVTGIVASSILSFPGGAQATALAGPVSVASSTTIGLQGANVEAVAGPVSTRIIETKLNPNYIALGAPRIMVAAGALRSRIVVGINNQMAETNTLIPAIDADVEIETVTFDFGLLIVPGVTLTGQPTLTCEVFSGTDPDPSSRIIGDWDVGISPNTGQPNAAVFQRFGQMLGGVIYRLQCVMQTTDGQDLSLWTHLGCQTPN